jgi:hypothetical protein
MYTIAAIGKVLVTANSSSTSGYNFTDTAHIAALKATQVTMPSVK